MKKRCGKILIVLFALFTVFMTTDSAKAEGKLEIPSLRQHIYVYDQENIINDDVEDSINKMLEEVEEKTTSEFFVITINSLNDETIDSYANDIFNEIGIGKKDEDNGLLLLIYKDENPEESKVRIEVGMGFEGFITDSISGRVLDDYFVPYREKDDYDSATSYTTQALAGLIAKEYDVTISGVTIEDEKIEELQEEEDFSIPWPVVAVIILLIILDFIFNDGNITLCILYALASGSSGGGRSGGGGRSAGGGASR